MFSCVEAYPACLPAFALPHLTCTFYNRLYRNSNSSSGPDVMRVVLIVWERRARLTTLAALLGAAWWGGGGQIDG